jgi:outer membrane receptor protein involved in Fe transport
MNLLFRNALTICCLAVFLGAAPAEAEEPEEPEVEMFFAPAEAVTIAARHAQPMNQSPSAVTVLTREDIETSGARTLPEVLRLVPNMDVQAIDPFWYGLGVRGNTTSSASNLLLLVDGRDLTLEFLGFPAWTVQNFPMEEVERIEVIRGPGSALYGANAYAGIVHVITRKAGEGPRASASVRGGEHGQTEMSCRGTGRVGPVAVGAAGGMVHEDLWTARDMRGKKALRGKVDGTIELGPESQLLVEAGAVQTSGWMFMNLGQLNISDMVDAYARTSFQYDELMVQAVYERLELDGDPELHLYYKDLGVVLAAIPHFAANSDKLSIQAQETLEMWCNRTTFGGEYVFHHLHAEPLYDPDFNEHRIGVFVQDELDLGAIIKKYSGFDLTSLIFTAGLRFDDNTLTSGEFSPRASLIWMPIADHGLRLGYAHAFLKPTFFQSHLHIRLDDINNLGFDDLDLSEPGLENQTIDSLELGYTGSFLEDKLLVKLDLAYNWYRNNIRFEYDPDKLDYRYVNELRVPDLNGPGIGFANQSWQLNGHNVELQVVLRPTQRSRLFVNAGYRQVFYGETGRFSEREPVWRLSAGADLGSRQGWTVSVRAFHVSSYWRETTNPASILEPEIAIRIPATWFLNARLAWKLAARPLDLTVGLEVFNLLGFRFREYAGLTIPNGPDYGAERLGRRIVLFVHGQI